MCGLVANDDRTILSVGLERNCSSLVKKGHQRCVCTRDAERVK